MYVIDVLKDFIQDLNNFCKRNKEKVAADHCFYILIKDDYLSVDMKNSYWRYEDDGTVVFVVNDQDEIDYKNGLLN